MCQRQEEFRQQNTVVLIISFGTLPALQQWMRETCSSFEVLLTEIEAYKAYGLERSFSRSRSLKTRWYYLKAWLSGKKSFESQGEDTSQLGGDFIVDPSGPCALFIPATT
ncbi:MAG: AhpC/TSA family protein [Candidatus Moduliflexus flocculans]|nr:AhpC/TSA family protein [Candidatus Moduliflexus flocculans]